MKLCNSPGRKNERRIRALARMTPPDRYASYAEKAAHPYEITQQRIVPAAMARAVRTKKDRSGTARITR